MEVSLGRHEDVVLPGSPGLVSAHLVVSVLSADTGADCVGVQTAEVEGVAVEATGLEVGISPPVAAALTHRLARAVLGTSPTSEGALA